ncbi:MAG TPA: acyl carrier protein [Thermoanaerobaculia bacterium]|jgi:acyl carrier protein|nr:acyl carrier protein [Thermoanaerobaculia bacterium]
MTTIESEVLQIVSRVTKVPVSRFTPDTDLKTDLNVDSLQGLQIVAAIENRFDVVVPEDEIDIYTSVRTIADTVERLQSPEGRNKAGTRPAVAL